MIKSLLFIFLGGGLGSALRFGVANLLNQDFPYGTLTANLTGSLLIGLFLGLFERHLLNDTLLLLFAVGFCGGFTTFSSFAAENLKMLQLGNYLNFFLYSFGSVAIGIFMVWIGFLLAKIF